MDRRNFLISTGKALILLAAPLSSMACNREYRELFAMPIPGPQPMPEPPDKTAPITLFLCGDVMTGRGIDQVLPHPSDPRIHEPYMESAVGYVALAEKASGPISRPVSFSYIWGDALHVLDRIAPDVRIINLETAVTSSDDYWKGKGINYRMHPKNIPCITAAKIDCCALANNHVLDWGYPGLIETLDTLKKAHIGTAGAGRNLREAESPAITELKGRGRVVLFAFGTGSSGIPLDWAASLEKGGVNRLKDLSDATVGHIAGMVREVKRPGDIVVASLHWGENWGYEVPREHTRFAHQLVDEAGVDVIHGHSSHHAKGIEVYRGKPVIYGCGDFLNDYEGIGGYEEFRDDLTLMYFVSMYPLTGTLASLEMVPMQIKHFRLNRVSREDARWLRDMLNREGRQFGTRVEMKGDHTLALRWR